MGALDRIAAGDWPALQVWARVHNEPLEVTAETFEQQYLGEWPTLAQFARDRVQWEYDLPTFLLPFFDDVAYLETAAGPDGCFVTVGHPGGVYVFQTCEEPSWLDAALHRSSARGDA